MQSTPRVFTRSFYFLIFIDRIKYYLIEAGTMPFADDTLLLVAAPSVNLLFDKMRKALV